MLHSNETKKRNPLLSAGRNHNITRLGAMKNHVPDPYTANHAMVIESETKGQRIAKVRALVVFDSLAPKGLEGPIVPEPFTV